MSRINKILRLFKLQVNKTASLDAEKLFYQNAIKRISRFYLNTSRLKDENINREIAGIVFSKDRAMQLHALLSSYFYYTLHYAPITILYTYSNEDHKKAYEILQKEFKNFPVSFIFETDFSGQLKTLIHDIEADRIFFMTDDGIFLDHYNLADCLHFNPFDNIFTLRLGADFNFCYSHNRQQTVPDFSEKNEASEIFRRWVWKDMPDSPDWIYPLSVDATIFLKKELEMILHHISFKSPNSLEAQMQLYNDLFVQRKGICYAKVKYVNVPCNVVQSEFDNNITGVFSASDLVDKFLKGKRIDWRKLENLNAPEAQLVKFLFV